VDTVGVGGGHSVFPARSKALQFARCETPRDRCLAIHGRTDSGVFFWGVGKESAAATRYSPLARKRFNSLDVKHHAAAAWQFMVGLRRIFLGGGKRSQPKFFEFGLTLY